MFNYFSKHPDYYKRPVSAEIRFDKPQKFIKNKSKNIKKNKNYYDTTYKDHYKGGKRDLTRKDLRLMITLMGGSL